MKKKWLLGGLVLGGVASVLAWRRRGTSGYDDDAIDAAGQGDAFGERIGNAPEQKWAVAETQRGASPEELSMAARVETSFDAIREVWPMLTLDDIRPAEGDLDRLAGLIADKVGQPREDVRGRLEGIIEAETPRPSFPAQ